MSRFDNQLVVVTGVARAGQAGEVIARAFAERGATVVVVDRDGEGATARAAELRRDGLAATALAADLTDPADAERLARAVRAAHGDAVHALVCAAGGFASSGPVAESDVAVLHRQLAINLVTAYTATRAFLPALRAARGAIVYFASAAVLPGASGAGIGAYAASKAGVLALMRAVAAEERAHGVRANAVAPTAIRTAANEASMGEDARYVERESVADVVCVLCGAESRDVTGQVLRLGS